MLVYVISLLFITYYISSRHGRINIISTVNFCAAIVVARYIKRIRDVTRDLRRRRRTNDGRMCPLYAGQPAQSNDRHTLVGAGRLPSEKSKPVLLPVAVHMDLIIIICAPLYCNSIPHIRVFISLILL